MEKLDSQKQFYFQSCAIVLAVFAILCRFSLIGGGLMVGFIIVPAIGWLHYEITKNLVSNSHCRPVCIVFLQVLFFICAALQFDMYEHKIYAFQWYLPALVAEELYPLVDKEPWQQIYNFICPTRSNEFLEFVEHRFNNFPLLMLSSMVIGSFSWYLIYLLGLIFLIRISSGNWPRLIRLRKTMFDDIQL